MNFYYNQILVLKFITLFIIFNYKLSTKINLEIKKNFKKIINKYWLKRKK